MSSVRKPRMPKPRIPKIKKPSISKRKKIRVKPSVGTVSSLKKKKGRTARNISAKSTSVSRHHGTKHNTGTCYLQFGCRNVLAQAVSKTQCKKMGGKSWRKKDGICERLEK